MKTPKLVMATLFLMLALLSLPLVAAHNMVTQDQFNYSADIGSPTWTNIQKDTDGTYTYELFATGANLQMVNEFCANFSQPAITCNPKQASAKFSTNLIANLAEEQIIVKERIFPGDTLTFRCVDFIPPSPLSSSQLHHQVIASNSGGMLVEAVVYQEAIFENNVCTYKYGVKLELFDSAGTFLSFPVGTYPCDRTWLQLTLTVKAGQASLSTVWESINSCNGSVTFNDPKVGSGLQTNEVRFKSLGDTADSADYITFESHDTIPPTWPAGSTLTASNIGTTSLTLAWTAALNNDAYRIYKNGIFLTELPNTYLTYSVTGLAASTTYTFKVEARDTGEGQTTDGPSVTVTTTGSGGGGGCGCHQI